MNVIDKNQNKIPLHIYIYKYYMSREMNTLADDVVFAHSLFFSSELMYPPPRISEVDKVRKLAIEFKKHLPRPLRVQYIPDKLNKSKKLIKFDVFDINLVVEAWVITMSNWRNN